MFEQFDSLFPIIRMLYDPVGLGQEISVVDFISCYVHDNELYTLITNSDPDVSLEELHRFRLCLLQGLFSYWIVMMAPISLGFLPRVVPLFRPSFLD